MSRPGTTLANQELKYDEVMWDTETRYGNAYAIELSTVRRRSLATRSFYRNRYAIELSKQLGINQPLQPLQSLGATTTVNTPPAGLKSGMPADTRRPPYWAFSHVIDAKKGLVLTDIKVIDTVSSGSIEEVFERIEFSDLKIFFHDGESIVFDLAAALSSTTGTVVTFTVAENGQGRPVSGSNAEPMDSLYQRGLKLEITTNVLASLGGTCNITLVFSVVFRGAKNDFDPGGVPVAMIAWPQYSFKWSTKLATKRATATIRAVPKRVTKFIGSIKMSMVNKMHSSHMHHGTPLNENVSGLYTDSNTSFHEPPPIGGLRLTRRSYYNDHYVIASLGSLFFLRKPFGWSMVFDYLKSDINNEVEIVGVYGPEDGEKYTSTSRVIRYRWLDSSVSPGLVVRKAPRQGMYDNMHSHAKMSSNDRKGNVQIHAPFCGHSCIHTHWRWSNVSSWGFISDTPKYMGWGAAGAHSEHNAPLVPPNQKVRVALCRTTANSGNNGNSFSDTNILNPDFRGALDPLHKMFWYRAEIIRPNADETQVAMEQGIGWAYRYSTLDESQTVKDLNNLQLLGDLYDTSTQHQISAFFEDKIYPAFRYKGNDNQIPQGSHTTQWDGHEGTSMEDL